jgi:hypothetical protein
MRVILIVYDAKKDVAYWLYVQAYFQGQADFNLIGIKDQITVHIPRGNVLDRKAVRRFAPFETNCRYNFGK